MPSGTVASESVVAADDECDIIRGLVAGADAIIEGTHSGRNPYGIDNDAAREVRPDIIHITLPGFGDGHQQAGTPGTELLISAATGVYTDRSKDASEGVSFIALPYVSIFGAMVAAPALAAALYHRERTGEGQAVTVPLYDAMFTAMGSAVVPQAGRRGWTPADVPGHCAVLPLCGWTLDQPERHVRAFAQADPGRSGPS